MTQLRWAVLVGVVLALTQWCGPVAAENIDFTHVTIVGNATPFDAPFDVSNIATNNATWPVTDGFGYASQGQRANTFVDFMFDQPYTFDTITLVDRLHSGANPTTLGGTLDYVTAFDLILSQNASFGDGDDVVISQGPFTVPAPPLTVDSFVHEVPIGGLTAQYLRYDVVATPGANPGAHTFLFDGTAIPEPATLIMALAFLPGLFLWRRRAAG
jgi:hypothetical protein